MIAKEYISRKALRNIGSKDTGAAFETLYKQANEQVQAAVQRELTAELNANHTAELLDEYQNRLKSDGIGTLRTQQWAEENIPALHQIETEWCEIVLNDLALSQNRS